jgi:hypothetical protein
MRTARINFFTIKKNDNRNAVVTKLGFVSKEVN